MPTSKRTSDAPTSESPKQAPVDTRKPFVSPRLTRESTLVDRTAERFFTFTSTGGGS